MVSIPAENIYVIWKGGCSYSSKLKRKNIGSNKLANCPDPKKTDHVLGYLLAPYRLHDFFQESGSPHPAARLLGGILQVGGICLEGDTNQVPGGAGGETPT